MDWTDLFPVLTTGIGAYLGQQAGGPTTTTTSTQVPPEMMGQWNAFTKFSNQVADRPYQSGVAPMTQDQYMGMDQIRNLSMGGPEQQAASGAFQNFMKGPENNPYLQGLIRQGNDEVMNRMNTGAFASGSFGNSGVASQTAKALADSNNGLYNAQLTQMGNMIPQGLAFQNQNLGNASALLQSGGMQQYQGQSMLTDYLNYPQKQMAAMGAPLGYNMGQTSTMTNPGNQYASALGGGLLGLQFGDAFNKIK